MPPSRANMEAQQAAWSAQISHNDDTEPWDLARIGGLDVHWIDETHGVACLVVLAWPVLDLVATHCHAFETDVPYEPGFLGFREVPAYLRVWADAKAAGHEPDVVLIDGFGACHPRGCGSACHLGLATGARAIGVAKSLNDVPTLRYKEVKERMAAEGLTELLLRDSSGAIVAIAVLKSREHKQPVFVSVGHRVSLRTALDIVRRCCNHKIPEPVRRADIHSRQEAERLESERRPNDEANSQP